MKKLLFLGLLLFVVSFAATAQHKTAPKRPTPPTAIQTDPLCEECFKLVKSLNIAAMDSLILSQEKALQQCEARNAAALIELRAAATAAEEQRTAAAAAERRLQKKIARRNTLLSVFVIITSLSIIFG